jgi:hypothetical protein
VGCSLTHSCIEESLRDSLSVDVLPPDLNVPLTLRELNRDVFILFEREGDPSEAIDGFSK